MNIAVQSENDKTAYSVHNPAFKCAVHHPHMPYEFFVLGDRIEPHVHLRLFLTRAELTTLRDQITAILNVGETTKDYVTSDQPEPEPASA